jgi:hypothetical protein
MRSAPKQPQQQRKKRSKMAAAPTCRLDVQASRVVRRQAQSLLELQQAAGGVATVALRLRILQGSCGEGARCD